MGMRVGVGRTDITPEIGGFLYGYRPDVTSTSVHDQLTATAVVVSSGQQQFALLSVTVCLVDVEIVEAIHREIAKETKLSPEQIIVAPTHTHSGPRTKRSTGWGEIDIAYCEDILIPGCVRATVKALENMQNATMGIGTTESTVGINRRELGRDNQIRLGQCPWGIYDPTMTVISFIDAENKPLVNLIHYGAHLTSAGMNREITRDWAGVMEDRMEKETGAVSVFLNSCEGDVGPRLSNGFTVGDISHVTEIGSLAALDAMHAYHAIREYRAVPCHMITGELRVPLEPIMPLEQAKEELSKFPQRPDANLDLEKFTMLQEIKSLHRRGDTGAKDFVHKQTIAVVGPIAFIPIPFEHFSEISLRLRAYSPYPHTLTLSNGNGNYTYLPTQGEIARGGYEIETFRWLMPRRLPDNTDYHVIRSSLALLEELASEEDGAR